MKGETVMFMICLTSANILSTNNDTEIIENCIYKIAEKNSHALAELYNITSTSVYAFALSILKNTQDAEDVLHDCYINIHAAAGNYQSKQKPMAWILTITKNLCLQKLREYKKKSDIPQEDWQKYLEEQEKISSEDKLVLKECMNNLSDEERQIVVLHAVGGFKHREIAEILLLPLPTVLSKYNRALKKLKKAFMKGDGQ